MVGVGSSYSVSEEGVYTLIALIGNCEIIKTITVTISINNSIVVPNFVSINNDGRNDIFLKDYDLVVVNRWGQKMYEGKDGWDGTYNGEKVSPGTYYYVVTLVDITDRPNIIKGNVLLIQE